MGIHPSGHYQWTAVSGIGCYQQVTESTFNEETESVERKTSWDGESEMGEGDVK